MHCDSDSRCIVLLNLLKNVSAGGKRRGGLPERTALVLWDRDQSCNDCLETPLRKRMIQGYCLSGFDSSDAAGFITPVKKIFSRSIG